MWGRSNRDIERKAARAVDHVVDPSDLVDAFNASQALIVFEPDGTIVHANANFLDAVGYTPEEVTGRHHRMFMEEAEAQSQAYRRFWDELAAGAFKTGRFRRIAKGGRTIGCRRPIIP